MSEKKMDELVFTEEERKLILHIRGLYYGEMSITVREGKPTRIEEIRKSILLSE